MSDEAMAQVFKALGEPVRLAILRHLPNGDGQTEPAHGVPPNVSTLAEQLNLSQPTVSHHLCVLKQAGLVKCRKRCRDKYYWVDQAAFDAAVAQFRDAMII